jgi:hypothetical protein
MNEIVYGPTTRRIIVWEKSLSQCDPIPNQFRRKLMKGIYSLKKELEHDEKL